MTETNPRGFCYRAISALRSRTGGERTADDLWPIGLAKVMDADNACATEVNDHVWSEPYVSADGEIVMAGCMRCSAVKRLAPAPEDFTDRAAVESWLDA